MKYMASNRQIGKRTLAHAVAAAIVVGYSIVASASTQVPADRTITTMGAYNSVGYVQFTPAIANLEGCAYSTGDQVLIDWSVDPNAKAMYATALAAHVAGRKVGFGVSGCHAGGTPLAYRVDVGS